MSSILAKQWGAKTSTFKPVSLRAAVGVTPLIIEMPHLPAPTGIPRTGSSGRPITERMFQPI